MSEHRPKTAALIAYSEDLLSDDGRRRLETHLEGCEVCRAELAAMELYDEMIDSVHSTPMPKLDFQSMSMTLSREAMSLSVELKAQKKRKSRMSYAPYVAVALAAAALLAVWAWPSEPAAPVADRPEPAEVPEAPGAAPDVEPVLLSPVVTLAAGGPLRIDGDAESALTVGDPLPEGTSLRVAEGEAHVRLSDDTGFVAYRETALALARARRDGVRIELETGAVGQQVAPLDEGSGYVVAAGAYEMEVRGTRFVVSRRDGIVGVDLTEGSVVVRGPEGEVVLVAPARWRSGGGAGQGDPEPVAVRELRPVEQLTEVRFHHPEVVRWRFDDTTLSAHGPVQLRAAPGEYELQGWDEAGHLLHVTLPVGETPVEIAPEALEPEAPRIRPGHLEREQIEPVVSRGIRQVNQCYRTALRGGQDSVAGRARLRLHLTVDGAVRRAQVVGMAGEGSEALQQCIRNYASRWTFPPPGGPLTLDVPLNFAPVQ